MIRYRADWLLPIAETAVRDGWFAVEDGCVAAIGSGPAPDAQDLGPVVVLPALVNAHTHLELSYLRGRIPPGQAFLPWIKAVMAARREYPDAEDPLIIGAAEAAIAQARATGTGVVGDVSNTLVTVPLLRAAGMRAQVFYELLGFNVTEAEERVAAARVRADAAGINHSGVRISLAAHAPYSVAPALFQAIRADLDTLEDPVSTVHLGESADEVEMLRRGTGGWPALLRELGVWTDAWQPPGTSSVDYLSELGFLDRRVLAVHGVQFDGEDLTRLAALRMTIVSCPRSNRYVGVGDPPLEAFYAMDVDVAFGTDSLASVPDLNLFSELAAARRLAPRVPARRLLESATLIGARALRVDDDFGTIEVGKRAALIAVRVPPGVTDVEEYLVSGIEPDAIAWLGSSAGTAA